MRLGRTRTESQKASVGEVKKKGTKSTGPCGGAASLIDVKRPLGPHPVKHSLNNILDTTSNTAARHGTVHDLFSIFTL